MFFFVVDPVCCLLLCFVVVVQGVVMSHEIDNSVSGAVISIDNLNYFRGLLSFYYNVKMSGVKDLLDKETEVAYNKDCL